MKQKEKLIRTSLFIMGMIFMLSCNNTETNDETRKVGDNPIYLEDDAEKEQITEAKELSNDSSFIKLIAKAIPEINKMGLFQKDSIAVVNDSTFKTHWIVRRYESNKSIYNNSDTDIESSSEGWLRRLFKDREVQIKIATFNLNKDGKNTNNSSLMIEEYTFSDEASARMFSSMYTGKDTEQVTHVRQVINNRNRCYLVKGDLKNEVVEILKKNI